MSDNQTGKRQFSMFKKADIILVAVLISAGILFSVATYAGEDEGAYVTVTVDGKPFGEYPLEKNRTKTIKQGDAINVLEIKDGSARITEANCRGQDCVHDGVVSRAEEVIVTLYYMGPGYAFMINMIRVLVAGLLFTGLFGCLYSLSGALLSFAAMVLIKKTGLFPCSDHIGSDLRDNYRDPLRPHIEKTSSSHLNYVILIRSEVFDNALSNIPSICRYEFPMLRPAASPS